jgi:hypothetical protein
MAGAATSSKARAKPFISLYASIQPVGFFIAFPHGLYDLGTIQRAPDFSDSGNATTSNKGRPRQNNFSHGAWINIIKRYKPL